MTDIKSTDGGLKKLVRYGTLCGLFLITLTLTGKAQPAERSPVNVIGEYRNVKINGEHAYGYSIQLWKQITHGKPGFHVIGLISVHRGLGGDPATGLLENVAYNERTGELSFTAKVTLGLLSDKDHSEVPSRDALTFSGFLEKKVLRGTLVRSNELCKDKCTETKRIYLIHSRSGTRMMEDYQDQTEWGLNTKKILDRLGPQW